MHPSHARAPALSTCAALLVIACRGPQAAPTQTTTAPPATAAPLEPGEPIAAYVVAAHTDRKGVRWFGTMGKGVARHDGEQLSYLSPSHGEGDDVVASIAEDDHGDLWFAGHQGTGLNKYDGKALTRIWYEETRVRADRRGNIWASTRHAVYRRDGERFTQFPLPLGDVEAPNYSIARGRVTMELEDSRGHLWFATDGYGVVRHDGTAFQRFTKSDGLCSDTVWSIVEDPQGHIWLSCIQAFQPAMTGDGGLVRFDGERFTAFPHIKGLANNDIYTLFPDRAGNLWIGATGVGVYRHAGGTFTLFDKTDRPDLNGKFGLQALTEDQGGTLWFGFSGGLFRLVGEQFVHVAQNGPWK